MTSSILPDRPRFPVFLMLLQCYHSEAAAGAMGRTAWLDAGDEPMTDNAASEVLVAYEAAKQAHLPLAVRFRVGVAAWRACIRIKAGTTLRNRL